jgi:hypothetical protein
MPNENEPTMMLAMMGEDGTLIFASDDAPKLPDNIEDGVDENGIVEGHDVETYYNPFLQLIDGDGYLRVVSDGDFTNSETRIPYSFLEAAGWHKS